jgi:hypothetical protein
MVRSLKTTVSCIALALAVPYAAIAADLPTATSGAATPQTQNAIAAKANNKVAQQQQIQTAEKRKQITAEAMAAINETRNALMALDAGKKDDALAALERATGKLELILARDPSLTLAPTNVAAETVSVMADVDKVKAMRAEAQHLLDDGQVQAARHLLDGLASETVISVSNIPLATYPAAIKQAVRFVDAGKLDAAKETLQTALNTLAIKQTIIPLPVVASQQMLAEAEKLSVKTNRTDDENKKLDGLLASARTQLEFAEALGYGTHQDFKGLYAQLDDIKSKTSNGQSGNDFFEKIKSSLSDLVKSNQQQP